MKFSVSILLTFVVLFSPGKIYAQTESPETTVSAQETAAQATTSAESAEATESSIASRSAEASQKLQERRETPDLTVPDIQQKSVLASYLDQNPPGPLSWSNFIQHSIRFAVSAGVPANVVVLVLLFPVIASLIAASRHVIGLRGFGIYIPAVLSVALVSTGIVEGLIIFVSIVLVGMITKRLVMGLNISYLPRTALVISTISVVVLVLLLVAPLVNLVNIMTVNIFSILILVLLAENFLDAQARMKQTEAVALTAETIGLAFISSVILQWEFIQKVALTQPELLILGLMLFNFMVGKFAGLRLTEWLRFRALIEEE